MNPFDYQRATSSDGAIKAIRVQGAKFLGGGTNLIDLMKDESVAESSPKALFAARAPSR